MDEERYKSIIERVLSEGDIVIGSRTYKPWQQEVIDECNQLTDRIVKLAGFRSRICHMARRRTE